MKAYLITGSVLAFLAVALGAFGAHSLEPILEANNRVDTWETAAKYHFYHSLGILLLGALAGKLPTEKLKASMYLFMSGMVFFCLSLYVLALTNFTKLGMVAPIGGLSFMLGWLNIAYQAYKAE